jgi:hypothetical protein
MGGGGGGPSGPIQHSANLGHFTSAQLLDAASKGNPYVNDEMKKRGLNSDGTPIRPEWQSMADEGGLLKSQYQVKGDIAPDMRGLEAYRARALGQGPSEWANKAVAQQGLEEAGQRSRFGTQAGSAQAQARSGLASKFGLSRGAAERLAQSNQRDQMMGNQGIAASGALQRGNIGMQDESQKMQMLSQLPQQELSYLEPQKFNKGVQQWNIQNALNENTQKRAADQNMYNQRMQQWAGEQQGSAMRDSGGGGKK